MTTSVNHPALLTKSQLDAFRSQLTNRNEAVFMAPQLLEQVAILSRHLRVALGTLEDVRATVAELEKTLGEGSRCDTCGDERLRAALAALRSAAHEP